MMRNVLRVAALVACIFGLFAVSLPAVAQYEANGMPLGGFRLYPTLGLETYYDDNVYKTQTSTRQDYYFLEKPGFMLQSDWSRSSVDLYGWLAAFQYATLSSEDNVNWMVGGDGQLDIYRGLEFTASGSYSTNHESRTSPDLSIFAESPTEYTVAHSNAALTYHPYHFSFSIGGSYDRSVYDPTVLVGLPIEDNSDRNHNDYAGFVKGAYEFAPGYAGFVRLGYRDETYDLTFDRNGLRRANSGYTEDVGVDMQITHVITGQAYVGYLTEKYYSPLVGVSGLDFGANIDWNYSDFWAFHVTAAHTLTPTTIDEASTENNEAVGLAADYFILRNVKIESSVNYLDDTLVGTSRDDRGMGTTLGVWYTLNSNMSVKMVYSYSRRTSTVPGDGYGDQTINIGIALQI